MTAYAVIPAVDGNRRIKEKLNQRIGKWSLLEKTLICAKEADCIDSIFVSTNDAGYGAVADAFLAKTIVRPLKYCGPDVPSEMACVHAIEWGEWEEDDVVIMLQGTSPFRTPEQVDEAFERFMSQGKNTLISMTQGPRIRQVYTGMSQVLYEPVDQELQRPIAVTNGAIYISTVANLWAFKTFHQPVVVPYFMDKRSSIDIDDEFDLEIARLLVDKEG